MFKKFAIAATAIALTASAAAASSGFATQEAFDQGDSTLELNLVRSEGAGTVVLESLFGDVIATAPVEAGANTDVRIQVGAAGLRQDVIAKLVVGGEVKDELRIRSN